MGGSGLAAAVGGALYAVGHVGFGVWPLLFICLVPLWRQLDPARGRSLSASIGAGFAFGAAVYAVGYAWLWWLVDGFLAGHRGLGVVLWLAHGIWLAAGFAVHSAWVHIAWRRGGPLWSITVPSVVVVQWLQPQLFAVPLGAGLIHAPWLAQMAELGGPLLLTAWLAAVNTTVLSTISWLLSEKPLPKTEVLVVAAAVIAALVFGAFRTRAVSDSAESLRIGIVQANLRPAAAAVERLRAHRQYLEMSRGLLHQGTVDLLVWPESAYGPAVRTPLPVAGHGIRSDLPVPLLFGGTALHPSASGPTRGNAAFLIENDGFIRAAYEKTLLIPFAEFVPAASVWPELREWFPNAQRFSAPVRTRALTLGRWQLATPVCYEAVHAGYVRRLVHETNANLIITLANDAWFGDSQEPWIHVTLTRLRAIEHRTWLVRATNSGISAVIDPAGRIVARSSLLEAATLTATVHPRAETTLYTRFGDWPGWWALLLVVARGGWMFRRTASATRSSARAPDGATRT